MITLFAFPPAFGLPSPGPFAIKTEIHLKMMNLPYRLEIGTLDKAPKGKLPFIDDEGTVIADSTFIRLHLEQKYNIDLDEGLNDSQRALAWSIERLVEDSLYWPMVHARWADDANFAAGPAHFFDHLPDDVRDTARNRQRERVIGYLDGQGVGRLSNDEICVIARRGYAALSQLFGNQLFIMGDNPSGTDASVFAQVASALIPPFFSPVREAVTEHLKLIQYVDRMMALYYPDFPQ